MTRRPGSPRPPMPDLNYLSILRGYRHMEKHAEITIQAGERPQVDEDRERHQAEEITARIGSVSLSDRPLHPPVDNSAFWDLEDSFGRLAVEYDYFIGLNVDESEYMPA